MLRTIVKQPNGKHALYNFDANCFELFNKTLPEIRENLIGRAAARIESDIIVPFETRKIEIKNNEDSHFEIHVDRIKQGQGEDELSLCLLREAGILV